jgi:hypothetical protein
VKEFARNLSRLSGVLISNPPKGAMKLKTLLFSTVLLLITMSAAQAHAWDDDPADQWSAPATAAPSDDAQSDPYNAPAQAPVYQDTLPDGRGATYDNGVPTYTAPMPDGGYSVQEPDSTTYSHPDADDN